MQQQCCQAPLCCRASTTLRTHAQPSWLHSAQHAEHACPPHLATTFTTNSSHSLYVKKVTGLRGARAGACSLARLPVITHLCSSCGMVVHQGDWCGAKVAWHTAQRSTVL